MTRSDRPTTELEALTAHVAWVRALAGRLVRDPAAADDLAQDACLAAIQRPAGTGALRAWLAATVRNGARQGFRGAARRRAREQDAARAEAQPSAHELVERVATHRALVDAVLGLEPRYRDAILMRYFDGLAPAQIAARCGVPVATVKTRLQRGLDQLRRVLSSAAGPGGLARALAPLLAPVPHLTAPAGGGAASTLFGLVAMGTFTKLALLALVIVGGLAASLSVRTATTAARSGDAEPGGASVAAAPELARPPEAVRQRQAEAPPPPAPSPAESAAAPSSGGAAVPTSAAALPFDVRGRVLGASTEPLPGAAVAYRPAGDGAAKVVVADAAGTFVLGALTGPGVLTAADDERYVTLLAGRASRSAVDSEVVVALAPRLTLGGHVRDAAGRPIEGARLEVRAPEGYRARFERVMDHTFELSIEAASAADGAFRLAAPLLPEGELVVTHPQYTSLVRPLPTLDNEALECVLDRPALDARTLTGLVLDADGRPVADARVAFGVHGTVTDDAGTFRIDLDDARSPNAIARRRGLAARRIVAAKAGHLPASLELELDAATGEPLFPPTLVLRLGGPPLAIHGRVVDPAGLPVAGAEVWVRDASLLEFGPRGGRSIEAVVAGREENFAPVVVDDEGRFALEGLLDADYVVAAHDPETLLRVEREARAGGPSVTLVLDESALWRRVAGKVVDRSGQPVPGVRLSPVTDACRVAYQGQVVSTYHRGQDQTALSDERGEFELLRVPRELVYLRVDGEEVISDDLGRRTPGGLAALSDGRIEDLRVEVRLRMRAQVHAADPAEADHVRVLDGRGEAVPIDLIEANGRRTLDEAPLQGGRTDVLTVDDSAQTLVLLREGEEVRRVPLTLQRGALNRVDV